MSTAAAPDPWPYVWRWNRPPGRKGQRCRVLARMARNTCVLEFKDGYRVCTSRNGLRKAKPGE